MTKKTRLMILLVCVVCFFVISPLLVAYSMGYRFDFDKMKVTETGGIYVRTFPAADQITIDSNISQKPGLFSNWIFVQSLMPKDHSVLVKKNRYYDYSKTIPVQEKEVTKLENILLIKTLIGFKSFAGQIDYFSTSLNNQNIITATANEKDITISYHPLTSNKPIEAFSIAQTGKVSGIKWSNDSSKALIEIQSYNNNFYYLFDSALLAQITKTKPVIARLTYLDKKTTQVSFNPQDSQQLFFIKNNVLYSIKNNKTLA
ncbi:MAG: PEGA domain-containing protein, partial [Candidatus Staskawiczbacteria bacterium]|nr:PEGA domain-containing protein [Candidatus Staskawiczbacteria bacterium]